ncbi:MAG: 5-formyltetrahydrofolate cyclo-ligase [Firmicutes bacterium HGW-Firmicutes-7]|nr:MAG: 5-formyltetrahydrofolate cyclo-ligase [Firmicutes bacterium HGW-Firmicutes-7]
MEKKLLRKKHIFMRNQLPYKLVCDLSDEITEKFIESDLYKQSKELFIYVGVKNEVNTLTIIEHALKDDRKVAVPKTYNRGIMKFFYIDSLEELVLGNFGLLEPTNILTEAISNQQSLFLVPGIVFDKAKNRIGYGAGFYDNYLRNHLYHKSIALAYESQIEEEIPATSNDVAMNLIITEKNIYK